MWLFCGLSGTSCNAQRINDNGKNDRNDVEETLAVQKVQQYTWYGGRRRISRHLIFRQITHRRVVGGKWRCVSRRAVQLLPTLQLTKSMQH